MFSLFLTGANSARWAVLYAGSNGFYNYRHQADICNMYVQLKNRGFDDKHIIQCQYDDIAQASSNPFKGQIFHTLEHINVYPGSSAIDYTGKTVTAQRFYDVLTELPSTSQDYVYVYYDNHGGPGILGVPDGCGGYITSQKLAEAFDTMAANNKYKYLLFGIEACYAGSIGEAIKAPKMATITAANAKESSYAAVMDRSVGTYLTNEFSNYWMDYMDQNPDKTIDQMFTTVKSQTKGSHVMYYGDESMKSLQISLFFGTPNKVVASRNSIDKAEIVPAYLATKSTLKHFTESSDSAIAAKAKIALHDLIASQDRFQMTLTAIAQQLDEKEDILYQPCGKITSEYFEVLEYFTAKYGTVNGDDLPSFSVLVNLCNRHSVASIKAAIDAIC
jgi:legumain